MNESIINKLNYVNYIIISRHNYDSTCDQHFVTRIYKYDNTETLL